MATIKTKHMKSIKAIIYKKSFPVYVKPECINESRQNCHMLIFNLTEQQKDEVLELLNKFGDIVTQIKQS